MFLQVCQIWLRITKSREPELRKTCQICLTVRIRNWKVAKCFSSYQFLSFFSATFLFLAKGCRENLPNLNLVDIGEGWRAVRRDRFSA